MRMIQIYENDLITDDKSLFKVEYHRGAFHIVPLSEPISEKFATEHPKGLDADQNFLLTEQKKAHKTYVITSVFFLGWLLRVVRNLVKDDDFSEEHVEDGTDMEEDKPSTIRQRLIEAEAGEMYGPFETVEELMRALDS